jgi:hypothetical protein
MMPPGFPPFMPPPMMGMPPPGMFPPTGFPPFSPFGMLPAGLPGMSSSSSLLGGKFKSIDDKMKEYKNHYDDVSLSLSLHSPLSFKTN